MLSSNPAAAGDSLQDCGEGLRDPDSPPLSPVSRAPTWPGNRGAGAAEWLEKGWAFSRAHLATQGAAQALGRRFLPEQSLRYSEEQSAGPS